MEKDSFAIASPELARVVIAAPESSFGLTLDSSPWRRHALGYRAAPLFELEQPLSPDDGWQIRARTGGRCIDATAASSAVADAVQRWAGSSASRLTAALALLPPGAYCVVRSPRAPDRREKVLLGNQWNPAPPNIVVLRDEKPVYAAVVGAEPGSAPRLDSPLVGLAILNYVGESWMDGVLFFSFAAAPTGDAPREPLDLLLILPVEGELVLDNMGQFSDEGERESRARWRDERAPAFARWCAGEAEDLPET